MKITLTGSVGHVSRPLARQLIAKGHTVTVISSNTERKKEIEALGAIAAIGSVTDARFLIAAFAGADAVYAHLRAGYFFDNLYNFIDMIRNTGFIGANYGGEDKIAFTSTKDIAKIAAEELTTLNSGNVRYIASEDITANAAARIIGAGIGKPDLQWVTFTDGQALKSSKEAHVPSPVAELFIELGASIHSGIIREDFDRCKPELGESRLTDFARQFAAAYHQK